VIDVAMPARTDRLHVEPYWLGDSPRAVRNAARQRVGSDGGRFIDLNLQRTADGVCGCHWGTPRANGYLFIVRRSRLGRRALTDSELDRPLIFWSTRDVKRLRRTRHVGTSYGSRVRIHSYAELVRICKRSGVVPCFELKTKSFDDRELAARMVKYAQRVGALVYFMTLVTMPNWRGKVCAFHSVGAQVALLAHDAPKPADLANYRRCITRIWGSWA
jgi:hypothetical protein